MLAISPMPNVGVGMRKMMLFAALAALKLGCCKLQAPASVRPVTVNRSSTPPLGALWLALPNWSKKNGKRASRTGPLARTKYGMGLVLPFTTPLAITWLWGFGPTLGKIPEAGLVPPGAGCEWHAPHESKLNRGPRPGLSPVTVWCSLNCASPVWKKAKSFGLVVTEASGWPAFTPVLLRTPGSVWASNIAGENSATKHAKTDVSCIVFIPDLLRLGSAPSPPVWRTSKEQPF